MNKLSKIPWFGPEIGEREKQLVSEVLNSAYINDGEVTRAFETKVAKFVGAKHCVAVTSGTAAITLALMGLGVVPGDEVIIPDLTFIGTANAVKLAGAVVKLVDIEPERFTIDVEKVEDAIGLRTRAIVSVDVNGRGANYDVLEPLVKNRGLFLVCDAAEALGSKYKGQYLGSFGDAACFSFSANKTVTTGQGGMIATNNTELYYRLLELKDQGRRKQGTGGNDLHPVMGFNFKLTNLQAAVGIAQMERLSERLQKAQQRDMWYRDLLSNFSGITFPPIDIDGGEVLQWTDILIEDRVKLSNTFNNANIGHRAFWYPLHTQKPYLLPSTSLFTSAVTVSERGLWLPSYFSLTREQSEFVAKVIMDTMSC